ncbi:MAG: insulinase family protein [Bryobacterales bacterium]|nr:insulinase family protein [Bryobacterales bacterium]
MKTQALIFVLGTATLFGQAKLPPYTRQTLPNGATLIMLRKPDVPLVSVTAAFRGGSEAVAAEKTGLAAITAELLRRGTEKRTADQINEQLDSIGAVMNGGSDAQSSVVSVEFTTRTSAKALDLFADILLHPAFSEAEFKKLLAQRIDAVKSSKDNPARAIGQYFNPFVYPAGHPYARPSMGDETTLANITRDDVSAFFKKNYVGKNMILIAAGDFDPAQLGTQLTQLAAALPAGDAFPAPKVAPVQFAGGRLLLIDKPDATQTYFRIAMPGVDRYSRDRVPLMIINTLFGGRFTSMLNDALRVNAGLTYGARSQVTMDRAPGVIFIDTYTRTETTEKAIDMALDVLKGLRANGISAEQLASAKAYIKGGFPTQRLETADQLADVIGDLEIFGLNKGEIDDLFSSIDAVTVERANAVVKKYFTDANLQFLLVGNASKIQDSVKKYAPKVKVIAVTAPGFSAPAF